MRLKGALIGCHAAQRKYSWISPLNRSRLATAAALPVGVGVGRRGATQFETPARSLGVVMVHLVAKHALEMAPSPDEHSRRTVRIQRSAKAFACGAR